MIRLYNTLGRRLEELKPITDGEIKLYTCGPTVYDYAHIGNLRSFVFDDTLRRMLEVSGYKVRHVMNITDVGHLASDADEGEDKLEKGAIRESKSVWEVAKQYIDAFLSDMRDLNVLDPNAYDGKDIPFARATDFIEEQLSIVKLLMDGGYAYQTEGAIYFDVAKLDDYGKLTGQKLSDKEVGARDDVIVDKEKKHPQDFALWFFKVGRFAEHSMSWPSEWGDGFPGWHLECSAIIHAVLKEPLDIHTGGVDHIGTHHTNEIAQTEAAFGAKLANYWLHNEHLLVENAKMSKSKGNYFTLTDVKEHGFEPLALRLLFLQSHYRSQTNFTWDSLSAASKNLVDLRAVADMRFQARIHAQGISHSEISEAHKSILDSVQNDLATPSSLAILLEFSDRLIDKGINDNQLKTFEEFISFLDALLGLKLSSSQDITDSQKQSLYARDKARQDSDWTKADEIRSQLKESGIEILDTDYGQVWRRT